MNSTTRKSIWTGGALIAIASLLTFGPMQSAYGRVEVSVTADGSGSLAVAAAGSVAGGKIGTAPLGLYDNLVDVGKAAITDAVQDQDAWAKYEIKKTHEGVLYAGAWEEEDEAADRARASRAAAAVPATAAASTLPSVSAGPPATPVAQSVDAFDRAFNTLDGAGADVAPAGLVVDRFAPPVAAVGGSPLALDVAGGRLGIQAGGVRLSCDAPGAGCQNVRPGGVVPANPPIVGGVRPPPPAPRP